MLGKRGRITDISTDKSGSKKNARRIVTVKWSNGASSTHPVNSIDFDDSIVINQPADKKTSLTDSGKLFEIESDDSNRLSKFTYYYYFIIIIYKFMYYITF